MKYKGTMFLGLLIAGLGIYAGESSFSNLKSSRAEYKIMKKYPALLKEDTRKYSEETSKKLRMPELNKDLERLNNIVFNHPSMIELKLDNYKRKIRDDKISIGVYGGISSLGLLIFYSGFKGRNESEYDPWVDEGGFPIQPTF